MIEIIRELVAYGDWATARTLDAVRPLSQAQLEQPVASSFPSVLATLQHLLSSEAIWLRRWLGSSPAGWPADMRTETLPLMEARWAELRQQRADWLARQAEEDLRRDLPYTNLSGQPFSQTVYEQILHMVNHGTYHRGQITTMLHHLGAPATGTDLILFYRSRASDS